MPDPTPQLPPPLARGLRRRLYLAVGLTLVGIGFLGLFLPVLPTTPFLLLASFCFARSSPRLESWLRRTPYFGPLIRDWEEHRGVRPLVKAQAVIIVAIVIWVTVTYSNAPIWGKRAAVGLAAVGVVCILFVVPTARVPRPEDPPPP